MVLIPSPVGGRSVGEEYQVVKRGMENHDCGEDYNVGKGKQYHLPYDIEAWEEYQVGKRERGRVFRGRKSRLKMGARKNTKLYGTLYTPAKPC